jgi:glycosyltransferase involved in cell wall biosynthesis
MARPTVVQFNLSPTLGGAEVYTAFFSRALAARGWATRVVVDPAATFWDELDFGGVPRVGPGSAQAAVAAGELALVHAPLPAPALAALAGRRVVGIAHQAIYDGARPAYYDRADVLLAVSRHVIATLRAHGLQRVHDTPLYGVADLDRGPVAGPLVARARFDADRHKPRDRLFAAVGDLRRRLAAPRTYRRREGLTLGVVSRLAPLKQFPLLFRHLVPIIARHPRINLEIFGAAVGYKSYAALRAALAPLGERVRWWGHQRDVVGAYRALDFLLTGLPEREALGLNALEACAAGTPVLAVAAPPFTEILVDRATGFLYADPRGDGGADFARVLEGIERGTLTIDRPAATAQLAAFAFGPFADRVDAALHDIVARR